MWSLDESDCQALLAHRRAGHLVFDRLDGTTHRVPVAFAIEAGTIVFHISPAHGLHADRPTPVRLEAADVHPATGSVWRVAAEGRAVRIRRTEDLQRLHRMVLPRGDAHEFAIRMVVRELHGQTTDIATLTPQRLFLEQGTAA